MARIRSIKPEQPKDEDLALLPINTRYLFAFLPTLADREGRLEDRHRVIKLEIFPWDDVDVEEMLAQLCPKFIIRYENDGRGYIQIRTFLKHQRPNNKELPSTIPAPSKEQSEARFIQKKRSLIQKKASLIQNEGIGVGKGREGVGKGKVMDLAPAAQVVDIPKPKSDLTRIIEAYKHAKGIEMDDAAWNKAQWPRACKAGKSLLDCFGGDLDKAAAYLFYRAEHLKEAGLEWRFETIVKHAWDGLGMETGKEKNDGLRNQPLGADLLHGPRSTRRLTSSGSLAGEALRGLEHAAIHAEGVGDMGGPGDDFQGDHDD